MASMDYALTILDCSPELHQIIYSKLKTRNDRLAFISTFRTLYSAFRIRFTCDALQRVFVAKKTVVGFAARVHAKIPKYRPVVLVGVRVEAGDPPEVAEEEENTSNKSEGGGKTERKEKPKDANESDAETEKATENRIVDGDIVVNGKNAKVYTEKRRKGIEVEGRTIIELVLTPETAAEMMLMTGSMLKRYWARKCPECGRSRWICPECGGVSSRWEDCFTSCGYSMPCPSCMGTSLAMDYKDFTYSDDDESTEARAGIWRKLDEMDSDWLVQPKPS
ncbi:hypothetical protein B0H17DRAFT_1324612 [Mycena rosella]|uniref:Uncharacterized protein n=1 Tax=Mycena rosella TaxID=1033263 RepID=A0AAD7MBV4_MYCRO|nr:hypothetical protein B0H17DRAFT_1324612 [Mycena rosella]